MSDPAIIGWDSIGREPTTIITAAAELAEWPARAAANELTWEGWRLPVSNFGSWLEYTTPSPQTCDYFAMAHSLSGESGGVPHGVRIERWSGSAWVTVVPTMVFADDSPILVPFDSAASTGWRFWFTHGFLPADHNHVVSVAFIGSRLDMPTSIYGGHSPAALSPDAIIEPHYSERGEFLGRSVTRTGETGTYEWRHLDPAWYRANFAPFARYAMEGRGAFFIKWRPNKYDETIYGWSEGRIRPSNMGIGPGLMEVSVNVRGLAQPGMRY